MTVIPGVILLVFNVFIQSLIISVGIVSFDMPRLEHFFVVFKAEIAGI